MLSRTLAFASLLIAGFSISVHATSCDFNAQHPLAESSFQFTRNEPVLSAYRNLAMLKSALSMRPGTFLSSVRYQTSEAGIKIDLTAKNFSESQSAFTISDAMTDSVSIPEPGTLSLFGSGMVGLAVFRRKLQFR